MEQHIDQISRRDLKTILVFALHVARVDNDFAASEKEVLKHLFQLLHLSEDERTEMIKGKFSLANELTRIQDDTAKQLLVKILCAVAHADHHEDSSEVQFIRKVNRRLGHPMELLPFEDWEVYEYEVLSQMRV